MCLAAFLGCRIAPSTTINQTCRHFICASRVCASAYRRLLCSCSATCIYIISTQSREFDGEKWIHLLLYGLLLHKHVLETQRLRRHITTHKTHNICVTLFFCVVLVVVLSCEYFILWIIQPTVTVSFCISVHFQCLRTLFVVFSLLVEAKSENWNICAMCRVQCLRCLSNIPTVSRSSRKKIQLKSVRVVHAYISPIRWHWLLHASHKINLILNKINHLVAPVMNKYVMYSPGYLYYHHFTNMPSANGEKHYRFIILRMTGRKWTS